MIDEPVYYLDGGGCVLCEGCAEESKEDFAENFRPASGPHNNPSPISCDECSETIPDKDGNYELEELMALRRYDGSRLELYHMPAANRLFEESAEEVLDEMLSSWEAGPSDIIPVVVPNSKFGSGSDGGYGGEVYIPLDYLISTGYRIGDTAVDKVVSHAIDHAYNLAMDSWFEEYGKHVGLEREGLTWDAIDGVDGSDQFNDIQQEHLMDEGVTLRFGLFYYGPDNATHGMERGAHKVYAFLAAIFDGAYMTQARRQEGLDNELFTLFETTSSFNPEEAEDLRPPNATSKLFDHLVARLSGHKGDMEARVVLVRDSYAPCGYLVCRVSGGPPGHYVWDPTDETSTELFQSDMTWAGLAEKLGYDDSNDPMAQEGLPSEGVVAFLDILVEMGAILPDPGFFSTATGA